MTHFRNVSSVAFQGNYIIPFDQLKDSATTRAIGYETAKYVDPNDIMQRKDGIVVKIDDDKRAKEYEAIVAKYGINIHKYDGPLKSNADLDSYAFMVSKLYSEQEAQQKFAAYKTLNDEEKRKEYLTVYNEFKKSKYSVENKINTPMAISFNGKNKKAVGEFANKNFEVECSGGLTNRSISGSVDGLNFNIQHDAKFLKSDILTGNIGNKELNLKVKEGFSENTITGILGDDPIDLKASPLLNGYHIKGKFKNKDIDIKLNSKIVGYSLESDNMSLRIKNNTLFGNNVKVEGTYNEDPDLIPILMDIVYSLDDEVLMDMAIGASL